MKLFDVVYFPNCGEVYDVIEAEDLASAEEKARQTNLRSTVVESDEVWFDIKERE